jgi:hypothetical protein
MRPPGEAATSVPQTHSVPDTRRRIGVRISRSRRPFLLLLCRRIRVAGVLTDRAMNSTPLPDSPPAVRCGALPFRVDSTTPRYRTRQYSPGTFSRPRHSLPPSLPACALPSRQSRYFWSSPSPREDRSVKRRYRRAGRDLNDKLLPTESANSHHRMSPCYILVPAGAAWTRAVQP